ncbi:unnamed protein product [Amoebophrya sp. A120]|nr:unnamed protein product [Amoebophrya sp. A120]|eukprot:GSA120T00024667001.1
MQLADHAMPSPPSSGECASILQHNRRQAGAFVRRSRRDRRLSALTKSVVLVLTATTQCHVASSHEKREDRQRKEDAPGEDRDFVVSADADLEEEFTDEAMNVAAAGAEVDDDRVDDEHQERQGSSPAPSFLDLRPLNLKRWKPNPRR